MLRERCPSCGGYDIQRMPATDVRYCATCRESPRDPDEDWSDPGPLPPPHRSLTDAADPAERGLVHEICAAPDDDHSRLVYADWLMERGDPLGTFIGLQCRRAMIGVPVPSPEETALLSQHWRTWLGAAASVVAPAGVVFERGMWSECDRFDPAAPALLAGDDDAPIAARSWRTVHRLAVYPHVEPALPRLLQGPLRGAVRTIEVWSRAALAWLATIDPPLAAEELALASDPDRGPPALPDGFPGIPALRVLSVRADARRVTRWLAAADVLGIRTVRLVFAGDVDAVRKVIRRAKPMRVERVELHVPADTVIHGERDLGGQFAVRAIELRPSHVATAAGLVSVKEWMTALAVHLAPDVVTKVPRIEPALVPLAMELGLRLVGGAWVRTGVRVRG
jgi:uncharacterized protein (TIGR02996 family)